MKTLGAWLIGFGVLLLLLTFVLGGVRDSMEKNDRCVAQGGVMIQFGKCVKTIGT